MPKQGKGQEGKGKAVADPDQQQALHDEAIEDGTEEQNGGEMSGLIQNLASAISDKFNQALVNFTQQPNQEDEYYDAYDDYGYGYGDNEYDDDFYDEYEEATDTQQDLVTAPPNKKARKDGAFDVLHNILSSVPATGPVATQPNPTGLQPAIAVPSASAPTANMPVLSPPGAPQAPGTMPALAAQVGGAQQVVQPPQVPIAQVPIASSQQAPPQQLAPPQPQLQQLVQPQPAPPQQPATPLPQQQQLVQPLQIAAQAMPMGFQPVAANAQMANNPQEVLNALQHAMTQEHAGPAVDESLAAAVNQLLVEGLPEDRLNEVMNSLTRPENLQLAQVKVNAVIWQALPPNTRSHDIKLQRIHTLITKSMMAACGVAGRLQSSAQAGDVTGATMFPTIMNCLALLAAAAREVNFRRREAIRPTLNHEYAHLCAPSTPVTTELFGDNVSQTMRDLSDMNRAGAQLRGRSRGRARGRGARGRFTRYRGNYTRRPFLGQGSGRGRYSSRGRRGGRRGGKQTKSKDDTS